MAFPDSLDICSVSVYLFCVTSFLTTVTIKGCLGLPVSSAYKFVGFIEWSYKKKPEVFGIIKL